MAVQEKIGVLLINTGSAASTAVSDVRQYLGQFLMDDRVIDIPTWKRWLLVHGIILRTRPSVTAEAYEAIWTDRGSPLIAFSEDLRDGLREALPEMGVEIGMAYGEPSIEKGMDTLLAQNPDRIVVAPMFPQYASATTGAVLSRSYTYATSKIDVPSISVVPPYYVEEGFLESWQAVAAPVLNEFQPDHVLLSYHGLPERQVYKADASGQHCLKQSGCCDVETPSNKNCYRRQCMATSKELITRLGLEEGKYSLTFQSRLGKEPWLEPATDITIEQLAKQGVKRLAILSPAFTADCLETLEEIGMAGKELFMEHGGEDFTLVPSLNAHPKWVESFAKLIQQY